MFGKFGATFGDIVGRIFGGFGKVVGKVSGQCWYVKITV